MLIIFTKNQRSPSFHVAYAKNKNLMCYDERYFFFSYFRFVRAFHNHRMCTDLTAGLAEGFLGLMEASDVCTSSTGV